MHTEDKNDLERFRYEQNRDYDTALREVRRGKKVSHWIWYIFPQLRGLGRSSASDYYGIRDLEEAKAYLADHVYGGRLREISQALLDLEQNDPREIFGYTDAMKVCSCMTLFELADESEQSAFSKVLEKFYGGHRDLMTLAMLKR